MIKVENIEVWGFEHAIRGMRNPMNSWDKSDSYMCDDRHCGGRCCYEAIAEKDCNQPDGYHIGKNDLDLMRRLYKAGTEHRKYLRQIFVSMDITAPLYWWKEFDTYKVGTVANSCSTMHKIAAKEFELNDFSHEHLRYEYQDDEDSFDLATWAEASLLDTIEKLNRARELYLKSKDKKHWWLMIQLLPSSYNQKRTVTMNYENVVTMIRQRTGHKLDEWNDFVSILKSLPYVQEIIKIVRENED